MVYSGKLGLEMEKCQLMIGHILWSQLTRIILKLLTCRLLRDIKGKERKLLFPSNEPLKKYKPPFMVPSFVKLDSLVRVQLSDCANLQILHRGQKLDAGELRRIIARIS